MSKYKQSVKSLSDLTAESRDIANKILLAGENVLSHQTLVRIGEKVEVNQLSHSGKSFIVDEISISSGFYQPRIFATGYIIKLNGERGSYRGQRKFDIDASN
ncbi:MAG: hypothetical protein COA78_11995 [Blastopirellula sp.]|nr:MAG: hypothetical protein COA78_11995 [Blastopirellula sp.]